MSWFGKKPSEETVVLLDIESGSVGSGLVRLVPGHAPELLSISRIQMPVPTTRSAHDLMEAVSRATRESVRRLGEFAARLKHHGKTSLPPAGKVAVFLSAPWGVPNLERGRPDFSYPLAQRLALDVEASLGALPLSLHTHAAAVHHGLGALGGAPRSLITSVGGEVAELLATQNGKVVSHATIPFGIHTVIRTLKTHGGMSEEEARSALKLGAIHEPMRAAGQHFADEFAQAAEALRATDMPVLVLSHGHAGEWLAQTLENTGYGAKQFVPGHVSSFVRVQAPRPDAHLMLNSLYLGSLGQGRG